MQIYLFLITYQINHPFVYAVFDYVTYSYIKRGCAESIRFETVTNSDDFFVPLSGILSSFGFKGRGFGIYAR